MNELPASRMTHPLIDIMIAAHRERETSLRLEAAKAFSSSDPHMRIDIAPFIEFLAGEAGAMAETIEKLATPPESDLQEDERNFRSMAREDGPVPFHGPAVPAETSGAAPSPETE
jgi:hypothetical protein